MPYRLGVRLLLQTVSTPQDLETVLLFSMSGPEDLRLLGGDVRPGQSPYESALAIAREGTGLPDLAIGDLLLTDWWTPPAHQPGPAGARLDHIFHSALPPRVFLRMPLPLKRGQDPALTGYSFKPVELLSRICGHAEHRRVTTALAALTDPARRGTYIEGHQMPGLRTRLPVHHPGGSASMRCCDPSARNDQHRPGTSVSETLPAKPGKQMTRAEQQRAAEQLAAHYVNGTSVTELVALTGYSQSHIYCLLRLTDVMKHTRRSRTKKRSRSEDPAARRRTQHPAADSTAARSPAPPQPVQPPAVPPPPQHATHADTSPLPAEPCVRRPGATATERPT
ncbi:hypothetical protein ACFU99_11565 [Streptomyces sp. NPDC057654]|uniref:hypothetical protein n=1 Tax=Streptomyces sp. NPDC057654 TaxID=3346196 RepID=UPI0036A987FB